MQFGLCLSSFNGIARLSQFFSGAGGDDFAWVLSQKHATENDLSVLAEALLETTHRRFRVAKDGMILKAGTYTLLADSQPAIVEGAKIKFLDPKQAPLHWDRLALSLAETRKTSLVVLMASPLLEQQGLPGLKSLHQVGAKIYAVNGLPPEMEASFEMLKKEGLPWEPLSCKTGLSLATA